LHDLELVVRAVAEAVLVLGLLAAYVKGERRPADTDRYVPQNQYLSFLVIVTFLGLKLVPWC